MAHPSTATEILLVVDDDDDVREILTLLFRDAGFEVQTCVNGADALAALEAGLRPSVIVLDLMMPVMNGWEFWDRHQVDDKVKDIPVVILTATGLGQGAVGSAIVLPKPVDAQRLIDQVRDAMARSAAKLTTATTKTKTKTKTT